MLSLFCCSVQPFLSVLLLLNNYWWRDWRYLSKKNNTIISFNYSFTCFHLPLSDNYVCNQKSCETRLLSLMSSSSWLLLLLLFKMKYIVQQIETINLWTGSCLHLSWWNADFFGFRFGCVIFFALFSDFLLHAFFCSFLFHCQHEHKVFGKNIIIYFQVLVV